MVGAGSAGCVVARRLAEGGNHSVLVLEAGDDPPITAMVCNLINRRHLDITQQFINLNKSLSKVVLTTF